MQRVKDVGKKVEPGRKLAAFLVTLEEAYAYPAGTKVHTLDGSTPILAVRTEDGWDCEIEPWKYTE